MPLEGCRCAENPLESKRVTDPSGTDTGFMIIDVGNLFCAVLNGRLSENIGRGSFDEQDNAMLIGAGVPIVGLADRDGIPLDTDLRRVPVYLLDVRLENLRIKIECCVVIFDNQNRYELHTSKVSTVQVTG